MSNDCSIKNSRATPPHRQNLPDVAQLTSDVESETGDYNSRSFNCQAGLGWGACDKSMGRLQKPEATSIICMLVHHADNGGLLWRKGSVSWRSGGGTFSRSWKR